MDRVAGIFGFIGAILATSSGVIEHKSDKPTKHSLRSPTFVLLLVGAAAVVLSIAWYFLLKPKLVCANLDKPIVWIVLPPNPSQIQIEKGDKIADTMSDLHVEHKPPEAAPANATEFPKGNNQIRFFFQANAAFSEDLANKLTQTKILARRADAINEEQNRLEGQFQPAPCLGRLEFWLSSAE